MTDKAKCVSVVKMIYLKMGLVWASVTLWFLPAAMARIGESEAQCKVRYGEVLQVLEEDGYRYLMFMKGPFHVRTVIKDKKCMMLVINKLNADGSDLGLGLSVEEIDVFLKANGGNSKWEKKDGLFKVIYKTQDGRLDAKYDREKLVIVDVAAVNKGRMEKQKEKQEALDDF